MFSEYTLLLLLLACHTVWKPRHICMTMAETPHYPGIKAVAVHCCPCKATIKHTIGQLTAIECSLQCEWTLTYVPGLQQYP